MSYLTLYEWCKINRVPYKEALWRLRDFLRKDGKWRDPIAGPSLKPWRMTWKRVNGKKQRRYWVRPDSVWRPPKGMGWGSGTGTMEGDVIALESEAARTAAREPKRRRKVLAMREKGKRARNRVKSLLRAVNRLYRREVRRRLAEAGARRPDYRPRDGQEGTKAPVSTAGVWEWARREVERLAKAGRLHEAGVKPEARGRYSGPWQGRRKFTGLQKSAEWKGGIVDKM